ncbi:MAG: hypothetical protein B7Z62_08885 [Deltaproteobacteria bacterium 37-65-8]|nr:MAG: hypothetical protein B7X01_03785 [Acidiphilium sp. 21-62-4]OYV96078.1 MAG: hypothetical protein B7Z62_08885 [Deltaproteobacteria bacterium 37-65-8]
MAFTPFTFTDAQLVDIRRYCGYPAYGDGAVVFPYPWIMKQYLALEYRLQHISASEGAVVATTYLANLNTLESAIPGAGANLDTDQAAVWTHNKNEVRDRDALFSNWRRKLCAFLGVPPGPEFSAGSGISFVV